MLSSRCFLTLAVALALPGSGLAQEQFFDSNGARIHYVDRGTGEPIVLIHGRGGSVQEWVDNGVLDNLAKDHRVIAFDGRGHGRSDKPHNPKKYGREMGLDVVRLLDHLHLKRAHVVGYSMGAMITAQLLALHPERFLTATLGGAAGRFDWSETEEKMYAVGADETEKLGSARR